MPAVFVLIWSTGFIVAKYGLPYAPPLTFLAIRYFLSIVCFLVWIVLARAAWPQSRQQWLHLAVTGILMHAAYLGGVWVAVKAGMVSGKFGTGTEVTALTLACTVFALISITAGTLYQKRFMKPTDVRTANVIQLAAAFVVTLPLALFETE